MDFVGIISLDVDGEGLEGGFSFLDDLDGSIGREDIFRHIDNDPEPIPSGQRAEVFVKLGEVVADQVGEVFPDFSVQFMDSGRGLL